MGKGDIRSRRGKIWRGTYGVTRPQNIKRKAPRPAVVSRKAKSLKDLPKVVAEPTIKKPVVEAVIHQVAETVPVIETVQPVVAGITAEVPQIVSETVVSDAPAKKAPVAKKPSVKKAPAAKKPSAKKAPAKKKK